MAGMSQDIEKDGYIVNTTSTNTEHDLKSTELGSCTEIHNEKIYATFTELSTVKRGLKSRHIQMIALAGTIGTGLFLATGRALSRGGPLGILIAYTFVGLIVCCIVLCTAELSALIPLSGGIVRQAEWLFDPALAFAQGWNSVYSNALVLPTEMVACAILIDHWTTINHAVWITVFGALLIFSNCLLINVYGEIEFISAILKILLILGINIMALCITAGASPSGETIGFRFWHDPGPFVQYLGISGSWGQFVGFWRVMSSASFAYSNVENIAVAAAETQNPRYNIPRAAKRIFWRVLIFYVITVFMVGLVVPSNDKALTKHSDSSTSSPFVIAATNAGITAVPSIITVVIITSAWSAGNSAMLVGSRTLFGLAREGHAPRFFTRTNRFGVPYYCVGLVGLFTGLAYMSLSSGAADVFDWFTSLVSAATFVHWINIQLIYLRFYYGTQKQNIDRNTLPWTAPFQPYLAWFALICAIVLLLTNGFYVFINGQFAPQTFISAYFNIPLILVLFFGYKFIKKTKFVSLAKMPVQGFIDYANENPEDVPPPSKGWQRFNVFWG